MTSRRASAKCRRWRRRCGALVTACHGDDRPDCPILDDLALGAVNEAATPQPTLRLAERCVHEAEP